MCMSMRAYYTYVHAHAINKVFMYVLLPHVQVTFDMLVDMCWYYHACMLLISMCVCHRSMATGWT